MHHHPMNKAMQACVVAVDFMARGSAHHVHICRECAQVCRACEASCRALGGTDECAEACRPCAEECEKIAAAM